jgi:hypothetical protein
MRIAVQDARAEIPSDERSPSELMELICKLRWIGLEQEAAQMQTEMHRKLPGGGVLTSQRETD